MDTYTYDTTGNLTKKTSASGSVQDLTWNEEGKLKTSSISGQATSFLYDAEGTRILKRDPAKTTLYLPGGQELELTRKVDTTAATISNGTRYYSVPGGSEIRTSKDNSVRILVSDHHNTNTLSIAASSLAVNRRKSLPYGGQRGATPYFWPGTKGFVGGDIDNTTGLTHIGAREYDTNLGQFISVDPILAIDSPQSLNGYSYANNSPVTTSDPTGMCAEIDCPTRPCANCENTTPGETPKPPKRTNAGTNGGGGGGGGGGDGGGGGGGGDGASNSGPTPSPSPNAAPTPGPYPPSTHTDPALETLKFFLPDFKAVEGCVKSPGINANCGWTATELPLLKTLKLLRLFKVKKADDLGDSKKAPEKPGCNCFLAGTGVLMGDGTVKDIEDVRLGDLVLAADPITGETEPREVTRLIRTEADKHFNALSIATENGVEQLTATYEHPFWSPSERDWIEADDLKPGMTLLTDSGDTVVVTANKAFSERARTYNLTVDDLHTYYVLAGKTPVLVHNSNCGILPTPSVSDSKLQNLVDDLYKGTTNTARTGDGTTMSAIREELSSGQLVHGRNHVAKGNQYAKALNKWISRNHRDGDPHDLIVARSLLADLKSALAGN
ncbi:polymorphic toxin-type HINT domain-containing protein [Streptomyces sp. NPDC058659]|uniref:polymorphic toxin-type HINT domain-containing protein n=1 Tax=unclassified Streptomyces TaxID=2593676 RepID=UPI003664F1AD